MSRTAGDIKPKTPFGLEVVQFTKSHGMTLEELAENAGVSRWTLGECCSGRSTGVRCNLIPIVRQYMAAYTPDKEVLI